MPMTPSCLPCSFSVSPSPVFGMYCHFSARTGSFSPAKCCSEHLLHVILDKPHRSQVSSSFSHNWQSPIGSIGLGTRHTHRRAHISGSCVYMCVCHPCGLLEGCHAQTTFKLCGEYGIEQGTRSTSKEPKASEEKGPAHNGLQILRGPECRGREGQGCLLARRGI